MLQVELLDFETRKSLGFYNFVYIPEKGDMLSLGDKFYKVMLRSHGFKEESKEQGAFAVVIKPTEEEI